MTNSQIMTYDGRQETCPLPLINTKLMLKKLQSGERLQILLNDTGSKSDIPNWLQRQGIEFTATVHANRDLELIIKKR